MQKKYFWGVNFIFLRKKGDFSDDFSAFYGQRSVTAAWATRSPWSIFLRLLLLTHFGETPVKICFPQYFGITRRYIKKKLGKFIFFTKKHRFTGVFSFFYGQRFVTAAWATPSP